MTEAELQKVAGKLREFGEISARLKSSQASVLHSHWSRSDEAWISLVERITVLLRQQSYAVKNQLGHPKTH